MPGDRDLSGAAERGELGGVLHEAEIVQRFTGIDHTPWPRAVARPAVACAVQRTDDEPFDLCVDPTESEVDPVGVGEQRRQALRELRARHRLVRAARRACPLDTEPRARPQLRLGVTLPGEDREPRLRAADQHRHGARLGQPGEPVQLPVRDVGVLGVPRGERERGRREDQDARSESGFDGPAPGGAVRNERGMSFGGVHGREV
mgnify:CR=1 FL=1